MPESTLTLTWSNHRQLIADELGYGLDATKYTASQKQIIQMIIDRGMRRAYQPPVVDGVSHQWSFLSPFTTITTESGEYQYDLPPEFGGNIGVMSFESETSMYDVITIASESNIRRMRAAAPGQTSIPKFAAFVPKQHDGNSVQLHQVWFFPTPDAAYTLSTKMYVNPSAISADNPYPYGGLPFSEVLLASCLAIAELSRDGGGNGTREKYFQERLLAAVSNDKMATQADNIGYMGDASDGSHRQRRHRGDVQVRYNGVLYS